MKLSSIISSSWWMAISLHLGLLVLLLGWPAFAKMQSLPQDQSSVSVYVLAPILAHSLAVKSPASQSPAKAPGLQKSVGGIAKAVVQPHTAHPQPIAPKDIQMLLGLLAQTIQQHLIYPDIAQSHIQQGDTVIEFDLQPNGIMTNIQIKQSSGAQDLDQAALFAVQKSSPIVMPLHLPRAIHLSVPLNFSLH